MDEKNELLKKIAESRLALQELEKLEKANLRAYAIKNLDEYTIEEKIKFFDTMYESALSELDDKEEKGYHDDDYKHYDWEEYIQILARHNDEFWKYWNSLSN